MMFTARFWITLSLVACLASCGSVAEDTPDADTPATDASASADAGEAAEPDAGGTAEPDAGDTVCSEADDCDDQLYCNGVESCDPTSEAADARGCVAGSPPCGSARGCTEDGQSCQPTCEVDADIDDDGFDGLVCGGTDCDDSVDGYQVGDWAHCSGCNDSCGVQQACESEMCVAARRVFVTSTRHTGNLGGLAGADAICQTRADDAGLGGTFKAYMVDESENLDRLEQATVPYIRLDGSRVADDFTDLSDASIQSTLSVGEDRQSYTTNTWTGLAQVSSSTNTHCDNWTYGGGGCLEGSACGSAGEPDKVDENWDGYYVFNCSSSDRLYCIEQ